LKILEKTKKVLKKENLYIKIEEVGASIARLYFEENTKERNGDEISCKTL